MKGKVFIGTSGFAYPHWKGIFYPENLSQKDWFLYYAKRFDIVELNVSFYRLPQKEAFTNWRKKADTVHPPAGSFVFAIKGWRWITHIKKLQNCEAELKNFFIAVNEVNSSISNSKYQIANIILWQLPPSLKFDLLRLKNFCKMLPNDWRYAFEFRHESWRNPKTWEILRKYKMAVVFQDYPGWPIFKEITADFVYLRFHGRTSLYASCYTEKELKDWAEKIKNWTKNGLTVYAYFNNDAMGYAVGNAKKLLELTKERE
ncbi:MAG: DUF72 domain-containing protein [Microgenomates group bacterium]